MKSMNIIRWLFSHLTLIVVLSLILYFYWNRNEIWSDNTTEPHKIVTSDVRTENEKIDLNRAELTVNNEDIIKIEKKSQKNEKSILKYGNIVKDSEKKILYPGDVIDSDNESSVFSEQVTKVQQNETPQSSQSETAHFKDEDLQKQIRSRQKQLQNQMVSLIPISSNKDNKYAKQAGTKKSLKEKSELENVQPLTEEETE